MADVSELEQHSGQDRKQTDASPDSVGWQWLLLQWLYCWTGGGNVPSESGQEQEQRWEEGGGGDSRRDKQRWGGRGVEGKQDVLGLYLLPLPLSRSSSYLRWSQSWPSFLCWPRSPGGASSARSARSAILTTPPYRPGSDQQHMLNERRLNAFGFPTR